SYFSSVESRRTVHQRRERDGLLHLPLVRLVGRFRIGDDDIFLAGKTLFRNQDKSNLARPFLFATQQGGIAQRVALAQSIDRAKGKSLPRRFHLETNGA